MPKRLRITLYVLLLALSVCEIVYSQGGFKKFYYLPGSLNSTATDVIETPSKNYLVVGRTDTLIGGSVISRLTFMGIDPFGNKLWTRSYGDLTIDYPDIYQRNQFYCAEQSHLFVYCTGRGAFGNLFGVLTKITYDGDTLWQKRYSDPLADMVPQVVIKAFDGGYYINGFYNIKSGGQPVYLLRIASNGDLIWKKIISKSTPNVMSGANMIQDAASRRIIITGYQYIGNGVYNNAIILDSLGNKIAHKVYNDGCGGGGEVLQLKDGSFITSVQMNIDCQQGLFQAKLVNFDIDGNVIWQKLMYPFGPLNSIDVHKENADGSLVAVGVIDSSYVTRLRYMILDNLGNVKRVTPFGRLKDVFVHDGARGGSFTSDGGYIRAMQLIGEPSPTPYYIIKLDSMGCDTVPWYCEWEKTVALKQQAQTLQAEVFPNPCRDVINVGVARDGLPATVNVFDQSGRKVLVQAISRSKNALDVSIIHNGFYLMEIRSASGVFRSNFVVHR